MSWLTHDQYPVALNTLAALRVSGQPFCWRFNVATTHEGRTVYGLRIHRKGTRKPSRAVLIVGGAHAREMVPPEAVLHFAASVCQSYVSGNDFSFGGKTYPAGVAVWLVEALELFVIPLLNPDGRAWVETMDQMWRKNRRPGNPCVGVDLNRNYDFLFTSGLGTSTSPCEYQVYRGPSAHSEPEVRGVRDLLARSSHIRGVLDVHSYAGLILYPWGDDQNQSTAPGMTFTNPAWDGQRGVAGDRYREHIVDKDWQFYQTTAIRMRDRVKEVAGRTYTAQQGFDLYATSGTLEDYPYSRHRANPALHKILSMTVEIGFPGDGGFRPSPDPVAQKVRNEGAVLIVEFCLGVLCAGDALLSSTAAAAGTASALRAAREELRRYPAGRRYVDWLEQLGGEAVLRLADPAVAREVPAVLEALLAWWNAGDSPLDEAAAARTSRLLRSIRKRASKALATALDAAIADVRRLSGKPASRARAVIRAGAPRKARRDRKQVRS